MANFNGIAKWNGYEGGFAWNGARNITYKKIYDGINFDEEPSLDGARIYIRDAILSLLDTFMINALKKENDTFSVVDDAEKHTITVLFDHLERLGFGEELISTAADIYMADDIMLAEKLNIFSSYFIDDTLMLEDDKDISTVLSIADEIGVKDKLLLILANISVEDEITFDEALKQFSHYAMHDSFYLDEKLSESARLKLEDRFAVGGDTIDLGASISSTDDLAITDYKPKRAATDFLIGFTESNIDNAVDWLVPFRLMVDWGSTNVPVMPEAALTTIELPYTDGSIVENAVYKDRMFNIVGFSKDGLTSRQKGDLKRKIDEILDSIKFKSKRLTIQDRDIAFDVRYEGLAEIADGSSYVKATIPFRATPYGYHIFDGEVEGSGLIDNTEGDAPLGVVVRIKGTVTDPTFDIGGNTFKWTGTVRSGYTLVVDHNLMTCYLLEPSGKKTNALASLTGGFYRVPKQTSVVISMPDSMKNHFKTTYTVKRLW